MASPREPQELTSDPGELVRIYELSVAILTAELMALVDDISF